MNTGILLVTHENLGAQLVALAESICRQLVPSLQLVSVPADLEPAELGRYADAIRGAMLELDRGAGVLVLTDLFGATPDNLARHFCRECDARVVSGLNLPMLLRVLNYAHLSLEQLSETAVTGGSSGVQLGRE